jgi:hypothetical protein
MTTASLCGTRDIVPHRASGYETERGALVNADWLSWTAPFAAGAICASTADLFRFERALQDRRLIPAGALAAMRAPTVLPDGAHIDYGLGTRLGTLSGHRVLGHTGTGGGFTNVLLALPDDDLTIVVLTNSSQGGALGLAGGIASAVLALPEPAVTDGPVPVGERDAITGSYESDEGKVEVFADPKGLRLRPLTSDGAPAAAGPAGSGLPLHRLGPWRYAVDAHTTVAFQASPGRTRWATHYVWGLFMGAAERR